MYNNVGKWKIVHFNIPEDTEEIEDVLRNILDKYHCRYKYLIQNVAIFDTEWVFEQDVQSNIQKEIASLNKDGKTEDAIYESEDDSSLKIEELEEILFHLSLEGLSEEDFITCLQSMDDYMVFIYESEMEMLEKIDYNPDTFDDKPLIHNIRKKNTAVLVSQTNPWNFAFVGYMKILDELKVTIKTFQYEILQDIHEYFNSKEIRAVWEDNLKWKWLFSRKTGQKYRATDQHIKDNSLMKDFLKTTKSTKLAAKFSYLLKKLLDKGYLEYSEYMELEKIECDECNTDEMRDINKFLQPYTRIVEDDYPSSAMWIDTATGIIFSQSEEKTDPKRISEYIKTSRIYAPTHYLLHYIRAFWLQDFVKDIFIKIKKKWEDENAELEIISIETDIQFDLKTVGNPGNPSRDIDVLVRILNISSKQEYIIAVEAKRYGNEFHQVKKEIQSKIISRYVDIFDGFIQVSYFNAIAQCLNEDKVIWNSDGRNLGLNTLEKPIYLCVSCCFNDLIEKVEQAIGKCCPGKNK